MEKSTKLTSIKNAMLYLSLLLVMVALIMKPDRYIVSAKNGLLVFASNVLPALFPFFFVTKLLTSLGLGATMGNCLKSPMRRLYHAPPIAGYVLFMSMISGYPIGAKLLAELYEHGMLTHEEVKCIMPYTSMPSPLFVVGTIGASIIGNVKAGHVMIISCVLGCLINGLLYRSKTNITANTTTRHTALDRENILDTVMYNSINSILMVGGYIVLFYILSDILVDIGVIEMLSNILLGITKNTSIDIAICDGIPLSLIEMTRGIMVMKDVTNLYVLVPTLSGIISFGGLAIMLQSMTFLSRAKIKVSYYLTTKLTQCVITIIVSMVLTRLMLI